MPLPVARWYDIVFVRVMRGIRVGAGMAWVGDFNVSARAVDWVPH